MTQKPTLAQALAAARDTRALEIGSNVLDRTLELFQQQFPNRSAVIVADTVTFDVAGRTVAGMFQSANKQGAEPFIFTDPDVHAEHAHVVRLEESLKCHEAVPIAVGSGAINDIVKLAAHRAGRGYLCVATAASMDGYTAFGASITHRGSKQTFDCPAPVAVVADIEIIRNAPEDMTAAGYADLLAKVTAGADWILADALGVEPMDPQAWNIVQGGLRDALRDPAAVRAGDTAALSGLTEGLMLGGFAMQWAKSSRPASGAEHQFSHLWDMQHHTHHGQAPSHGFKVGIGTLAVTALYEHLLRQPIEHLDVSACCAKWPDQASVTRAVHQEFDGADFTAKTVEETCAKHVTRGELQKQLEHLRGIWPELRSQLRAQLIPYAEAKRMLEQVGAPAESEQIGISRERLRKTFVQAYYIRRRFTVLDLVFRTQLLAPSLDSIFH